MRNYYGGVSANKMAGFVEQFDRLGMPLESMPDKVSGQRRLFGSHDASTLKSRT